MGCLSSFSKYIIFIFNFLFVIAAIVLIVFGVIFVVKEDAGVKIFDNAFSLGGLAIGIGAIIFVIAFFGCCGAIKQNTCMLTTYAVILLGLFVTQVVLGVLAILEIKNEADFRREITGLVRKLFDQWTVHSNNAFNDLQRAFECCGVDGPQDYRNATDYQYPSSCCKALVDDKCVSPFTTGCGIAFADAIYDSIEVIAYVAIGFAAIELLGSILAFMIQARHRKRRQYV